MRKIHLVRHAETDWNTQNRYAGHTDVPLSKNGYLQAQKLKNWALNLEPFSIYSSDLKRSVDTANPIVEALNLTLNTDSRLREVNFGNIEGLTPYEMQANFFSTWEKYLIKPAEVRMPNGESGSSALARALPLIEELMLLDSGKDILVISHGTLIRLITCKLLGIELNRYRQVFPDFRNISKITLSINDAPDKKMLIAQVGLLSYTP